MAIRGGTNQALMNALLHELIANGWYDGEYVRAHTLGFERLTEVVRECPPERAAESCGVPAGQIRAASADLALAQAAKRGSPGHDDTHDCKIAAAHRAAI